MKRLSEASGDSIAVARSPRTVPASKATEWEP
jgi:hypothetical protein